MEGLVSLDAVYIALLFFVPGYVFSVFRGHFILGRKMEGAEFYVRLLTLSAVNFALTGWPIYLGIAAGVGPELRAVLWALVILVLPAAFGLISGAWTKKEWLKRLYGIFGLNPIHHVPTSWDYAFSRSPGQFVLVVLKDGTQYGGWWASRSFASSVAEERDLLIEQVYRVPEGDGEWVAVGRSVLIAAGEIRTVEFINPEGEAHVQV